MRVFTRQSSPGPRVPKLRRARGFSGGIVLPAQLRPRRVGRIESLDPGRLLRVPLHCAPRDEPRIEVQIGESIGAMCPLDSPPNGTPASHAPVPGRVQAILPVTTGRGERRIAIEIETVQDKGLGGPGTFEPLQTPIDSAGWASLCDRFGVVNVINREPLSRTFRRVQERAIEHLIIRAMGSEPAESAAPAVLLEQGTFLIEAAGRLGDALAADRVWIALSSRFRQGRRLLARNVSGTRVTAVVLPDRYPQAAVPLLIQSVCGLRVPPGEAPEPFGACVVDTLTLCAFAQMTAYSLPMTRTVVTITGDAVAGPRDFRVPIGMSVGELIERARPIKPPEVVVMGGPLTGTPITDPNAVITRGTTCLTVLSGAAVRRRDPQACTRCGWCVDDCPVGLDPAGLMNLAERFDLRRGAALHPESCLECGVCSYVCPSHLDLARSIGELRMAVAERSEAPK